MGLILANRTMTTSITADARHPGEVEAAVVTVEIEPGTVAQSRVWIVAERDADYEIEVQFFHLCRDKALCKLAELVERDCTAGERERHERQVGLAEARGPASWQAISVEMGNRHEGIHSNGMTFLTLHAQPLDV